MARQQTKRSFKHQHATPNERFVQEENILLASVDRALASTPNSAVIGRNGEVPLLEFLNRYLPNTLRVASGHFLTPSGMMSPQIDIMVLDARYPLLSENSDGSVLVMLHSVIFVIEVKTNLALRDIPKLWRDAIEITELSKEVENQYEPGEVWFISTCVVAYRTNHNLEAVESRYLSHANPEKAHLDLRILRLTFADQPKNYLLGVLLHLEPPFPEDEPNDPNTIMGYWPTTIPEHTPLNDFYYELIWSSYFSLNARSFSFGDIADQANQYMSWSTAKWDESDGTN